APEARLRELQADFPFLRLELADTDLQKPGEPNQADDPTQQPEQTSKGTEKAQPFSAPGQTLHQALDSYAEWIREHYRLPTGQVSQGGNKMRREVEILKKHHADIPLQDLGVEAIDRMLTHWKHRPPT